VELYVSNLPWSVDDAALKALFAAHGAVDRCKVVTDRETGRSRGFGFVTMTNDAEAQAAIQAINGTQVQGRAVGVRKSEPRPPREGGAGGAGGGFGGGPRREGGGGFGGGRREGGGGFGGGRRDY
jgi:RNA recognition motif-containing protein